MWQKKLAKNNRPKDKQKVQGVKAETIHTFKSRF